MSAQKMRCGCIRELVEAFGEHGSTCPIFMKKLHKILAREKRNFRRRQTRRGR